MKIYKTTKGILIDHGNVFYLIQSDWDRMIISNRTHNT
jgi:hypothetical protein